MRTTVGIDRMGFDEAVVHLGREAAPVERPRLVSAALLAALRAAGTEHVYADTADLEELRAALVQPDGAVIAEVDGNTVNQPLLRKVVGRYMVSDRLAQAASELRRCTGEQSRERLLVGLYAIVCGWIGSEVVGAFAAGRPWEISLQLPMTLFADPPRALSLARDLKRMVPSGLVKVPFLPHVPASILVARDLEREGVAVNFTSTFSARQAVAAALLIDATRTNVFMGRLTQGLGGALVGEQVTLEAQRAIRRLRREAGVKTRLIVASLREWRSIERLAGCDVFTAPVAVLRDFLGQHEVGTTAIADRLDVSYEDRLGIPDNVVRTLGREHIARLWRVEPAFVEFLRAYGASAEYRRLGLGDGERLQRRFEEAGFGDFFHAPAPADWDVLRRSKLPDLASPLTTRIALDTLYTLLADGDFGREQETIDGVLARAMDGEREAPAAGANPALGPLERARPRPGGEPDLDKKTDTERDRSDPLDLP